jgi:hypothetical protein
VGKCPSRRNFKLKVSIDQSGEPPMQILLILLCLFCANNLNAEEILHGKLPLSQGTIQIDGTEDLPSAWVLEKEVSLQDALAVSIYLNAPEGTRAWMEITSLQRSFKTANKKKRLQKRSLKRIRRAASGKSWLLDFLQTDGKIQNFIGIEKNDFPENEGLSFLFPDACSGGGKYLMRLIVDFQSASQSSFPVVLEYGQSTPPSSQATLFKYPSEKSGSQAVILMRTSGAGPEFLHFTQSQNSVPKDIATLSVDDYYFSNLGIFTRVYLSSSFLTGQRVSMHHISADLTSIYSVCVSLQRKRQELEGYN